MIVYYLNGQKVAANLQMRRDDSRGEWYYTLDDRRVTFSRLRTIKSDKHYGRNVKALYFVTRKWKS